MGGTIGGFKRIKGRRGEGNEKTISKRGGGSFLKYTREKGKPQTGRTRKAPKKVTGNCTIGEGGP